MSRSRRPVPRGHFGLGHTARPTSSVVGRRSGRNSAPTLMSTVQRDTTPRRIGRPSFFGRTPDVSVRGSLRSNPRPVTVLNQQLTQRAITCARRTIRREVLFALRRTGKGSSAPVRRRTSTSKEKC